MKSFAKLTLLLSMCAQFGCATSNHYVSTERPRYSNQLKPLPLPQVNIPEIVTPEVEAEPAVIINGFGSLPRCGGIVGWLQAEKPKRQTTLRLTSIKDVWIPINGKPKRFYQFEVLD